MKKIISIFTALLFITTLLIQSAIFAFAAGDSLDFSLTNAAGMQNDMVTIKMSIDNNPGFWSFMFGVFYDSDALILREVKPVAAFTDIGEFSEFDRDTMNNTADQYNFDIESGVYPMARVLRDAPKFGVDVDSSYVSVINYQSSSITKDNMYTGDIIELTFEIVGIAEPGDYKITLVPDVSSVINTALKDDSVPYTWTNAVISVGSTTPKPNEDNTTVTPTDTLTSDQIKDSEAAKDTTSKTVETFVGDDGETYYIGDDGEKYVYDPEDFAESSSLVGVGSNDPSDPTETEEDKGDIDLSGGKTTEKEQKTRLILWIVTIAALLLIVAAILLFVFISQTKKEAENAENNDNNDNK